MPPHSSSAGAIEVVEPTLEDFSGHCHSLIDSFCRAAEGRQLRVWGGKGTGAMRLGRDLGVEPVFSRRLRVLQGYWLYRRLLRQSGSIVVMTAKSSDLLLLNLAAKGRIKAGKVFLYFHWIRDSASKRRFMQRMARKQPDLAILGTTQSVVDFFRSCGFANVLLQPYPMTLEHQAAPPGARDARLIYAGAARQDKGFGKVVDLVEHLARTGERLPITVQISADHYGKYDQATADDIRRLDRSNYPFLIVLRDALSPQDYSALFKGGICLQPYDREDFRDRVSGVTLDALSQACPVIATSETWSARLVAQHAAGIAVERSDVESLLGAAREILNHYEKFSANAFAAGRSESRRSWTPLLQALNRGDVARQTPA